MANVDGIAGEKERGTLQTLLCAPVRPMEIVAGKYLTVVLLSLVTGVVFADWIFFGLAAAGLFIFRARDTGVPPPGAFRVPGYPWLPAVFVLASAYVVASAVASNPGKALIGAAIWLIGRDDPPGARTEPQPSPDASAASQPSPGAPAEKAHEGTSEPMPRTADTRGPSYDLATELRPAERKLWPLPFAWRRRGSIDLRQSRFGARARGCFAAGPDRPCGSPAVSGRRRPRHRLHRHRRHRRRRSGQCREAAVAGRSAPAHRFPRSSRRVALAASDVRPSRSSVGPDPASLTRRSLARSPWKVSVRTSTPCTRNAALRRSSSSR